MGLKEIGNMFVAIGQIFNNLFHGKADTYLSTIMKMF
jgi:hypothetical protein